MTRRQSAAIVATSLVALAFLTLVVGLGRLLDEHGDELDGRVA